MAPEERSAQLRDAGLRALERRDIEAAERCLEQLSQDGTAADYRALWRALNAAATVDCWIGDSTQVEREEMRGTLARGVREDLLREVLTFELSLSPAEAEEALASWPEFRAELRKRLLS